MGDTVWMESLKVIDIMTSMLIRLSYKLAYPILYCFRDIASYLSKFAHCFIPRVLGFPIMVTPLEFHSLFVVRKLQSLS